MAHNTIALILVQELLFDDLVSVATNFPTTVTHRIPFDMKENERIAINTGNIGLPSIILGFFLFFL
jgi:hypothetical protein